MQGGSEFTEVSREVAAPELLAIVEHTLRELHAGAPGLPTVTLASTLDRDLGFDSLARTELLLRTERAFGIRLPDDDLAARRDGRRPAGRGAARRAGARRVRHRPGATGPVPGRAGADADPRDRRRRRRIPGQRANPARRARVAPAQRTPTAPT